MSILNNTKVNGHKHENQHYHLQKANLQLIINGTNNNKTKCRKILNWMLEDHQKDSTGIREKQVHNIA